MERYDKNYFRQKEYYNYPEWRSCVINQLKKNSNGSMLSLNSRFFIFKRFIVLSNLNSLLNLMDQRISFLKVYLISEGVH